MSLKVWLPLNGDLKNLGCSGYEVRSANVAVANDGKIGKCYSFNGSSSYINITNFEIGNNWSYGCWVNTPNSDSRGWEIAMILNNSGSDADSQFAFWIHQKENRFESLANTQYVSTIPYTNYYNEWHHFFATFNGSLLTSYIDGNVVNTKSITATQYNATNLTIGARSTNVAGTSFANWFQGKLNDVRIYDHCLSALEVKEISQGLVLHYKLDDTYIENGQNLCTVVRPGAAANATWGGHVAQWTLYDSINDPVPFSQAIKGEIVYGANGSTGGGASRSVATIAASPSTIYTYSCYIKPSDNFAYTHANFIYHYEYTAVSGGTKVTESGVFNKARTEYVGNGWYRAWGTFTTQSTTNALNISFYTYPQKNITYWVGGWQIEQKNHVTPFMAPGTSRIGYVKDSSGYENNGEIVGDITTQSTSPRFNMATYLNSSSPTTNNDTGLTYIHSNFGLTAPTQMSVCWWAKPENGYGSSTSHAAWCTSINSSHPTDYNSTAFHHRDSRFDICLNSASTTSLNLTFNNYTRNEWHYYCVTYDGKIAILYKDGIETNRSTISSTEAPLKTFTNIFIGYSRAGGVWRKTLGSYSDFRIYTTALSAEDIKKLYQTPTEIDKNGSWHTHEFYENGENFITKTGLIKDSASSEYPFTQHLKYDPEIYFEPDGSAWVHIYHHNNPGAGSFASSNTFANSCYIDANRWFNATEICNQLNKWEFLIKYAFTSGGVEYKERWIQTKNPENAVFADVAAASITRITGNGYKTGTWGGLYKKNNSAYWVMNNGSSGNWWGATGSFSVYQSGIPGYGGTVTTTGYNDLYVRIDNIDFDQINKAWITKSNIYLGNSLIEK